MNRMTISVPRRIAQTISMAAPTARSQSPSHSAPIAKPGRGRSRPAPLTSLTMQLGLAAFGDGSISKDGELAIETPGVLVKGRMTTIRVPGKPRMRDRSGRHLCGGRKDEVVGQSVRDQGRDGNLGKGDPD